MDNMNDRGKALVNAPGSTAPQTVLTTAHDINKAITRNLQGRNYGVYCVSSGQTQRVFEARTRAGVVQVRTFELDWIIPDRVWVEG